MLLHKTPIIAQWLYPDLVWKRSSEEKVIYLTFDDGPIPVVTPWVLKTLEEFNAKATFFCVGENVFKHPEIFRELIQSGHAVGNHTYHHLNGWETDATEYLKDFLKCEEELRKFNQHGRLFRPPYGKITRKQAKQLSSRQIIMWDVLSGDFSDKLKPKTVLEKSIRYSRAGSIIVFHDSLKAFENLQFTLPRYLEHFQSKGFTFKAL
ncbi:polysaccharide deacetylase family protein [Roseivirga echinicomitans]